ncbi:DUF4270 family protein [Wenyingzhuangia sp. IMCC45533]
MTLFNIKYIKTIAAVGAMVFFVSCSNDIATETGGVIDNESFKRETISIIPEQLSTESIDLGEVRTSGLSRYILGEYTDANFGKLSSDFVGQLTVDTYPSSIESGATISSAKLLLPLDLVAKSTNVFEISNFVGDFDSKLSLEVKSFANYLELFNLDGGSRVYFADGSNDGNDVKNLGTETVVGTLSDIAVEEEYFTDESTISVPLDTKYFEDNLLSKIVGNTAVVSDQSAVERYFVDGEILEDLDFIEIFKGLRINASNTGDGFVAPFNMSEAKVELIFNNNVTVAGVPSANDTLNLSFDRVNHNLYKHNHITANVPNELYIQGAGGHEVTVDLENFINTQMPLAEAQDWLINQATLTIFTKEVNENTVEQLYIHGVDSDGKDVVISDYGSFSVGGVVRDANGENTQGFVQFTITNYLRDAILSNSNIKKLRIKVRELGESTTINRSSTNARGVVLLNDATSDTKAPRLEVIYSAIVTE